MAYVVTEPCHDCKYTDCCVACPVDCFYQDDKMLYIDPEDCINCEACVPECPVEAIFIEEEVPSKWARYIQLNADRCVDLKAKDDTNVTEKQDPLEGPDCKKN